MQEFRVFKLLFAILLAGSIASCRQASEKVDAEQSNGNAPPATITLSAAASTKDAIEKVVAEYQLLSNDKININTGASNALANQILNGAPVDLFLSASPRWAEEVESAGLASRSVKLLTNRLAIIVPRGNHAAVESPEDLLKPAVKKIALAGSSVPAGQYAEQALSKLNLMTSLSSENKIVRGQDVRTALSYVEQGEAEAGIVYTTDAAISEHVMLVHEFAPHLHDEIVYELVILKQSEVNTSLDKFVGFIESPQAEKIFLQFGFQRLSAATIQNAHATE